MTERYEPTSYFLIKAINEEVEFTFGECANANLHRLILMTKDPDPINRDWATLLLSQLEMDTAEIRDALLVAAEDENLYVRGEAILGLAQRDVAIALPLLQRELSRDSVALQMFEAATLVADPSLAQQLEAFTEPSGDDYLDQIALDALKACRSESRD